MQIVIIGDGKMGFDLSERLSKEGHDIIVVDIEMSALEPSENTQDVNCVYGNGLDTDTLLQAGISSADLCRNIPDSVYCSTLDKVTDQLRQLAQPGDLILTVGAGDIYRAGEALLQKR